MTVPRQYPARLSSTEDQARPLGNGRLVLQLDQADGILGLDVVISYGPGTIIKSINPVGLVDGWDLVTHDQAGQLKVALYGTQPMSGSGSFLEILYSSRAGRLGLTEVQLVEDGQDGELKPEVVHPVGPFRVRVEANEGLVPVRW